MIPSRKSRRPKTAPNRRRRRESHKQGNHFTAYDLVDIYPFFVYSAAKPEKTSEIAAKLGVEEQVICKLNRLSAGSEAPKELLVPSSSNASPELRQVTVGDLGHFDFDEALFNSEPTTFIAQYHTLQRVVLGKLILTEFELMFEPLNPSLKGRIDQVGLLISGRLLRKRPTPNVRFIQRHDC